MDDVRLWRVCARYAPPSAHARGAAAPSARQSLWVLVYLLTHRARVVPKPELCAQVWPRQAISDATLGSTVREVRHALGDQGEAQRLLQTAHSVGYRWVAPVAVREASAEGRIPETEGGDVTPEPHPVARTAAPLPMGAAPPVVPTVPPPFPVGERAAS